MELKKEWCDEYEEDGEHVKIVGRRFLLVPGCCEESTKALRPFFQLNFGDLWSVDKEMIVGDATPEWIIPHLDWEYISTFCSRNDEKFRDVGYRESCIPVKFCPYCAKKMPEVRLKENPPTPVVSDDDSHCGTCNERAGKYGGCECWPMEALFEVVEDEQKGENEC